MTVQTPRCEECRWYGQLPGIGRFPPKWVCEHPKTTFRNATNKNRRDGDCGPTGKLFEKREEEKP
jgi:hypothetical protein